MLSAKQREKRKSARAQRLADYLWFARVERDVTQADLAKRLGHNQNYVAKYEFRDIKLNYVTVLEICDLLGIKVNHLNSCVLKKPMLELTRAARYPGKENPELWQVPDWEW